MKKLMMSILLTIAICYGSAFAQSGSTQTQEKTRSTQAQDKSRQPGTVKSGQDQAGWQKIGEKTIDLSKGQDELAVNTPEKFKAIRVKTENQAVDLTKLQLYYDTGEKQDVSMDIPIMANSESQVINLNESNHSLKKIVFACKPSDEISGSSSSQDMSKNPKNIKSMDNMKGSAKVEVWGLKAETSTK